MRDYVKYAGILFAITFVTALLLGVVNNMTSPVIADYNVKKETAAIEAVVDGKIDVSTEKVVAGNEASCVVEIKSYTNDNGKTVYAVKSVPSGYAGDIEMMVGIDSDMMVTGIEIVNMSETAGLGANAKGNTQWLSQFMGEGSEKLDALTGATITSKAIETGVREAREQVIKLSGGAEVE